MTSPIPFIPDNAPFTVTQRQWLNGYLAGLFSDANGQLAERAIAGLAAAPATPTKPLLIFFGSQTGTAEALAKKTAAEAKKNGYAPRVLALDQFASVELTNESNLLLITSTYGDGEPPDNAQSFWDFLKADSAPALPNLQYSVLALGDTNYPAFCQFGILCDERLAQLGATRVHPRTDCDIEYDDAAKAWTNAVFLALAGAPPALPEPTPSLLESLQNTEGHDRRNPFPARLLTNQLLNGENSAKEVRHYEISLAGSGLKYEVGDALGVYAHNCPKMVDEILALMGYTGGESVTVPKVGTLVLRSALLEHLELGRPSTDLIRACAARCPGGELEALLDPSRKAELKDYLWGREVIDVLPGTGFRPDELVALLKKLQPRLYSISSSPKAHPDQVHLTIAAVRYDAHGRSRKGVCSTFLADRVGAESAVPVFVQTSHGFRLPADPDLPVIMVGPGTGIAPFRAFLEERHAVDAKGKNWLFFGDQRQASDFLYREQLESMLKSGHLTQLDLAFSRDQAEKIYVQHRMLEHGAQLWAWLQEGAHFYVCGDASRMAKDVDSALLQIAERFGSLSPEAAAEYFAQLKTQKRYQRDVY